MKYGTSPNHIFKDNYDEIIKSAKRKYNRLGINEFYIFQDLGIYSESGICVYNDALEHWLKTEKGWRKDEISN